jgi:hypothetical protein
MTPLSDSNAGIIVSRLQKSGREGIVSRWPLGEKIANTLLYAKCIKI